MTTLKPGDFVRLREDIGLFQSFKEVSRLKGTKGRILRVDEQGYTVVFAGELAPVTSLTDQDIEIEPEVAEE